MNESNEPTWNPDLTVVSPSESCDYLRDQLASYQVRLIDQLDADQYDEMLRRGWRRQGIYFFRPSCVSCRQCVGLRVPLETFRPSRSQRRIWQRNADIRMEVGDLSSTNEIIQLFNNYHSDMTQRRGWRPNQVSLEEYTLHFHSGSFSFAREFRYFRGNDLVGLGLVDVTQRSASSIYFFHDPKWRPQGPGVFSMLSELRHVQDRSLEYHYLGYWIAACPSMAYKNRYRPYELLERFVADDEEPVWTPPAAD